MSLSGPQILAVVCLLAVLLTPPKRERRVSRIIWTDPQIGAVEAQRDDGSNTEPPAPNPAGSFLPGPAGPHPQDAA